MSDEHDAEKLGDTPPLIRPWPLLASKVLHAFPIYVLRQDTRRSPRTGKSHNFLVLDSRDWINVVPVTPAGNLVLIRQFRHGTASLVWEIPGGMMDEEDPSPEDAARRELLEETGYKPEKMTFLGAVHPNPAIQNNRCHTLLVRGVERRHDLDLDGNEEIAVRLIPFPTVWRLLREGVIHHALVVAAFAHYSLRFGIEC